MVNSVDLNDSNGSSEPSYFTKHFDSATSSDQMGEYQANGFDPGKPQPKKLSVKEAKEDRLQFMSERQKRLREKQVSLPYHKPKPRNFKEFFAQRPRMSDVMPRNGNVSVAVAIKMADKECANELSKALEERHTEIINTFYRSESEDEDGNGADDDETPGCDSEAAVDGEQIDDKKNADSMSSAEIDIECKEQCNPSTDSSSCAKDDLECKEQCTSINLLDEERMKKTVENGTNSHKNVDEAERAENTDQIEDIAFIGDEKITEKTTSTVENNRLTSKWIENEIAHSPTLKSSQSNPITINLNIKMRQPEVQRKPFVLLSSNDKPVTDNVDQSDKKALQLLEEERINFFYSDKPNKNAELNIQSIFRDIADNVNISVDSIRRQVTSSVLGAIPLLSDVVVSKTDLTKIHVENVKQTNMSELLREKDFEDGDSDGELISEKQISNIVDHLGDNETNTDQSDDLEKEVNGFYNSSPLDMDSSSAKIIYSSTPKLPSLTISLAEQKNRRMEVEPKDLHRKAIEAVKKLLKKQANNDVLKLQPRLSGGAFDKIEFDMNENVESGISELKKRYRMHSHKKAEPENVKKISDGKNKLEIDEKPNESIKRHQLKEIIYRGIVKDRTEKWEQHREDMKIDEENYDEDRYLKKLDFDDDCETVDDNEKNMGVDDENIDTDVENDDKKDAMITDEQKRESFEFSDEELQLLNDLESDENEKEHTPEPTIDDNTKRVLKRVQLMSDESDDTDDENDEVTENFDHDDVSTIPTKQPVPSSPLNRFLSVDLDEIDRDLGCDLIDKKNSPKIQDDENVKKSAEKMPDVSKTGRFFEETNDFTSQDNVSELLGLCSGKFLPIATQSETINSTNINSNIPKCFNKILSSSDDEAEEKITPTKRKVKRKKRTKIIVSDDEDDNKIDLDSDNYVNDHLLNEETSQECESDQEQNENDNLSPKIVDYDSEENEILIDRKQITEKAKDFFENEAELSESEWGSADEDERDLDQLEWEQGDADKFDEDKMQEELGKIHMRQVLDQDKREVRMLQEIYFEDGDLHSENGRQRQFKWANNNLTDNDPTNQNSNDCLDNVQIDDDNECEEAWRKARFEREKFFKQKMQTNGTEDNGRMSDEDDLFKSMEANVKMVELSRVNGTEKTETNELSSQTIETKESSLFMSKNLKTTKSILARGQTKIERLAKMARNLKDDLQGRCNTKPSSKSCVFMINRIDDDNEDENVNIINKNKHSMKRKAQESPFNGNINGHDDAPTSNGLLKKIKIDTNMSTIGQKLTSKVNPRIKKLFDNL